MYSIVLQILNAAISSSQNIEDGGLLSTTLRPFGKILDVVYMSSFLICSANLISFITFSFFRITCFILSLIIQDRRLARSFEGKYIQITSQAICLYYLYPFEIISHNLADWFLVKLWIAFPLICVLAYYQKNYGILCFLPNSWRHLKHRYEYKIAQDFNLTHLDLNEFPVCNFCMVKLHIFPSLCYEDSANGNSKTTKHDIYMKAPDSKLYHEQCLEYILKNQSNYGTEYPNVNEYDD